MEGWGMTRKLLHSVMEETIPTQTHMCLTHSINTYREPSYAMNYMSEKHPGLTLIDVL